MDISIKDIVKGGTVAKLSHYVTGKLFYTVETESGTYQFPIWVVDPLCECVAPDFCEDCGLVTLSEELGSTPFKPEYKAITLMRYMNIAKKNGELRKLKSND